MSLGWRRKGEEVEELSTGACSSIQLLKHPQAAEVAGDHLTLGNVQFQDQALLYESEPSLVSHDCLSETSSPLSPHSYL